MLRIIIVEVPPLYALLTASWRLVKVGSLGDRVLILSGALWYAKVVVEDGCSGILLLSVGGEGLVELALFAGLTAFIGAIVKWSTASFNSIFMVLCNSVRRLALNQRHVLNVADRTCVQRIMLAPLILLNHCNVSLQSHQVLLIFPRCFLLLVLQ